MPERTSGQIGRIVLGTMRLHEKPRSVEEWASFFVEARALGITTLHSSLEYESFPLLRRILERLAVENPRVVFRHMVKLGEPHFDDVDFDAERLLSKVDEYRAALGVDCVADIQWMWRSGLDDDADRIARFTARRDEIADAAAALKAAGKIERLMCFPYTPAFAAAALDTAAIDGLAIYRNVQETDYDAVVARAGAVGKPCIAIRPFNAGQAMGSEGADAAALLRYVFAQPAIESAVVSCSRIKHLEQLAELSAE